VKVVYSLDPPGKLETGVEPVADLMLTDKELKQIEFTFMDFKQTQKDLSQRVLAKRGINYST
jgi:hypothetical protein